MTTRNCTLSHLDEYDMKRNFILLTIFLVFIVLISFFLLNHKLLKTNKTRLESTNIVSGEFDKNSFKSDEEWKKILTPEQYYILREAGTEIPYMGTLNTEKRPGTYYSVGCDKPLFRSEQKYDSGTGWPSFTAPIDANFLVLRKERLPGDNRIEVLDTCGGHLGHVFDDGPKPTGKRYCINSTALRFVPDEK